MPGVVIRPATIADADALRRIYNHEVLTATSTFDLVTRSLAQQEEWIAARSGAFSAIVAVDQEPGVMEPDEGGVMGSDEGGVIGFAALSAYKDRAAYATTVEDSVYVDRTRAGAGVGSLLLARLIEVAAESGFHAVMARIEASGTASRALHAKCGFELVGIERQVGRKFNRWLDVAVMQRLL